MFDPYEFEELDLAGMKIFMKRLDYASKISVGVVVGLGGRDGKPGAAHLLEHCVSLEPGIFENAKSLVDSVRFTGGDISLGSTGRNEMFFSGYAPCAKEEALIKALSQLFTKARFSEEKFILEKNVVHREIAEKVRSLRIAEEIERRYLSVYHDHMRESAYELISLFSILGTPQELESIDKQYIERLYQNCFVPSKIKVIVTGNFEKDRIFDLLEKYPLAFEKFGTEQIESRRLTCPLPIYPKSELSEISMSADFGLKNSVDYVEVSLVSIIEPGVDHYGYIFKDIFKDSIFNILREKRGQAYSPAVFIVNYEDCRKWGAFIRIPPENRDKVLEYTQEALTTAGHDEESFEENKSQRVASIDVYSESSGDIRKRAFEDISLCERVISLREEKEALESSEFCAYEEFSEKLIDAIAVQIIFP